MAAPSRDTIERLASFGLAPYVSTPEQLAALRTGKQLKVSFQNLGKETITIPMPLADFAAAYDKIK